MDPTKGKVVFQFHKVVRVLVGIFVGNNWVREKAIESGEVNEELENDFKCYK